MIIYCAHLASSVVLLLHNSVTHGLHLRSTIDQQQEYYKFCRNCIQMHRNDCYPCNKDVGKEERDSYRKRRGEYLKMNWFRFPQGSSLATTDDKS